MGLFKKKDKQQVLLEKKRALIHKEMLEKATLEMGEEKVAPEGYALSLRNINKIYPNHVQAVYDFNLDIKENEFIVFVGPSGCGKSTTLRMIAGLESITYGDLFISQRHANMLPPKLRDIAMVFQNYALYPNLTVFENMAFGLRSRGEKNDVINEKVLKAAETLQLTEYLNRKPGALSGGQRQRVALGRAIVRNAKVFLMDEPLSNLDAKLRVAMRSEIVNIHNNVGATTIYVTHDQTEAMTMADRIVVMNKGYVQQIGTPKEIYNKPANIFVATFIGAPSMNIVNATLSNDKVVLENGLEIALTEEQKTQVKKFYENEITRLETENSGLYLKINEIEASSKKHKEEEIDLFKLDISKNDELIETYTKILETGCADIKFGVRPEDVITNENIALIKNPSPKFSLNVSLAELLGNEYFVYSKIGDAKFVSKVSANQMVEKNDVIEASFNLDNIHIFDPISTKRIF